MGMGRQAKGEGGKGIGGNGVVADITDHPDPPSSFLTCPSSPPDLHHPSNQVRGKGGGMVAGKGARCTKARVAKGSVGTLQGKRCGKAGVLERGR